MNRINLLPTIFLVLLFSSFSSAQTGISLFDQLTTAPTTVQLSLTTDVNALIINKKATDYQDAIFSDSNGKIYAAGVKPRGKFRRRISDIPPLKLKFKKKLLAANGLIDSLNELKLVLPTTLDEAGNDLVIREYLAYRMYETLSPYAVRARLIDLVLINTDVEGPSRYAVKAILLEDEEETAARLGGEMLDAYGMTADSLETEPTALLVMFQYMIGNTDWDISQQRNIRFFKTATGTKIAIPFDFDFCGLVNAPYATPLVGLGIQTVREHALMSNNLAPQTLKNAGQTLLQQQHNLLEICRKSTLAKKSSQDVSSYLEDFFSETQREQNKR